MSVCFMLVKSDNSINFHCDLSVFMSISLAHSQVKTAVEKSGPLHRLGAKISEIKAGLGSVQSWLDQKSLNFTEAESTQKVIIKVL